MIVNPAGQPVCSADYAYDHRHLFGDGRFLDAAKNGGHERPYYPVRLDSINRLVPQNDFRTTVAICDKLVANTDVVKGALRSKADYCIGDAFWPKFQGAAQEWGNVAERWAREQFYPIANVDGDPMHDLRTDLGAGSVRIDAAGSFGVLLTEYDGGFPAVQFVPTWRLFNGSSPYTVDTLKTDKAPDGTYLNDAREAQEYKLNTPLFIYEGVIYSRVGMRRLYYRVRLENADNPFILSQEYTDVHVSDFLYVYEEEYHEGLVGWPTISASAGKLRDNLQSHDLQQITKPLCLDTSESTGKEQHTRMKACCQTLPRIATKQHVCLD